MRDVHRRTFGSTLAIPQSSPNLVNTQRVEIPAVQRSPAFKVDDAETSEVLVGYGCFNVTSHLFQVAGEAAQLRNATVDWFAALQCSR